MLSTHEQLTDIPEEVGRCQHYCDGYVCDLYEGHEGFHNDYICDVEWTDELVAEPLPHYNAVTAIVLLGSVATFIGIIVLIVKAVR